MRVLLDESLPRRLKAELTEHEVSTVPDLLPIADQLRSAIATARPRELVWLEEAE